MPEITNFIANGQVTIPGGTLDSNDNPIGGLSGITYDPLLNVYYAISDSPNNGNGPVRFYTLSIDLSTGAPSGVTVTSVTTLNDPAGNPYLTNTSDTEGIALTSNGSVFVSSEGLLNSGVPPYVNPFVREFSLATGNQLNDLTIPDKFIPTGNLADPGFVPNLLPQPVTPTNGIRRNLAFESLTLTPDQQFLFTGTEVPLAQDSTTFNIGLGNSRNRILRFDNAGGTYTPTAEFLYRPTSTPGVITGLTDLLAVNSNTLIALERSAASANGPFTTRLYEVSLVGATDISASNAVPADAVPVTKTLIGEFTTLGNVEGLTFGPSLANGKQSLILISDNNFNAATATNLATFDFAFTSNNAPVVTPASPNLTAVPEDLTINEGDFVSTLLGASIVDVDAGALKGIAVTGVDNTNGTWEYSTDNGQNWVGFGTPSTAAARLLADTAKIRFSPNLNYSGSATITYQAWDQTSGTNGATVDISVAGSTGLLTAFSRLNDTAAIAVNAVADAPPLTVTPASGDQNTAIPLNINTSLVDTDGSENLSLQIAGVPSNSLLNAGTNLGGGIWQLSLAQLAGLTVTPSTDDDFTLTVTATATEISNSNAASTVANLSVTVNSGQGDPGQGDPGQGDPGQGDPGQGDPGQGDPGQGDPGQGDLGQGDPGQGDPGQGNPNQLLTLNKTSNNVFFIEGSSGTPQLQFTLTAHQTNFVNEIGVFVVNDDQGTIIDPVSNNSIAPGQNGYLQAAISGAKVIFSALSAGEFDSQSFTRQLSFDIGDRLGFYLVQDSTTDTVLADLAAGRTPPNVFFATLWANADNFNHLQVSDLGASQFTLAWEDRLGGGDQDFNDLAVKVELSNNPPPLGTRLQGDRERELIDLTAQANSVSAQFVVNSEAAFDNFVGLYTVDDEQGRVNGLAPGEAGYAQAALQRRVVELNRDTVNSAVQLNGGTLLAPYIIADGTLNEFLTQNPNNVQGQGPLAYFAYLGANPDGVDHVRLLGDNSFGFEDVFGGGDRDFNDMVLQVHFA
jgi:hypothetical protein